MSKAKLNSIRKLIPHKIKIASVFVAAFIVVAAFPTQFVKAVEIYEDGKECTRLYTFSNNAETILEDAEIVVRDNDDVTVSETGAVKTIEIDRAFNVTVEAADKFHTISVTSGTVKDAIKQAGLVIDEHDIISPSLETELTANMHIDYTNIDYLTTSEVKEIKNKTVKTYNFDMKEGKTKVLQKGKIGSKKITTVKTLINGVTVDSSSTEEILEKPVTEKIEIGATQRPANKNNWVSELNCKREIMLDKSGKPVNYKKVIKGVASAYCTGTTCSTGVSVKPGYIAVDPTIIPYGTEMYIRTPDGGYIYGYAIAADTGGFTAWGNTIADLYVHTYSEAINFGRRNIEIYILD